MKLPINLEEVITFSGADLREARRANKVSKPVFTGLCFWGMNHQRRLEGAEKILVCSPGVVVIDQGSLRLIQEAMNGNGQKFGRGKNKVKE